MDDDRSQPQEDQGEEPLENGNQSESQAKAAAAPTIGFVIGLAISSEAFPDAGWIVAVLVGAIGSFVGVLIDRYP